MKTLLQLSFLFCFVISSAQMKLEMTPQGFAPLELKSPNKPFDELLRVSKSWANFYNKKGADVFDVAENSLTIEARNENAYHTWNLGVKYDCDVVYTLKIVFEENKKYTLAFSVKEIYAENKLLKTTIADFFNAEGKVKDDFRDAKPSLENTANKIIKSYTAFIAQ